MFGQATIAITSVVEIEGYSSRSQGPLVLEVIVFCLRKAEQQNGGRITA